MQCSAQEEQCIRLKSLFYTILFFAQWSAVQKNHWFIKNMHCAVNTALHVQNIALHCTGGLVWARDVGRGITMGMVVVVKHSCPTSCSVFTMNISSNWHIYDLRTFAKMLITEKKTHTNRRHDRTRFDRVMVSRVSQNALKQSQRPPYGARFSKGSSHLFICML